MPLLQRARAEVLDDDVGGLREPAEHCLPVGGAQVDRHALAAAPLDRPEERVGPVVRLDERTDLAHEVAAARLLDLHDLGALFPEERRAERRGDPRAEIEDADAGERSAHSAPCSRFTAAMPPCRRASTRSSAVGVLETNWWSAK
ncbi:MAG: hypothetical protein KatS3mg010_0987 [Acidimicrobiia bacterium]|nr:MAG: hypothetical protein KatS3mg010_0987 [Acidimicrobiia bacterium]